MEYNEVLYLNCRIWSLDCDLWSLNNFETPPTKCQSGPWPWTNCWRAVARQPNILYNSENWPKSVGCKIVDLRSQMRSLYPGACGFRDLRSWFLYIRDMLCRYACECMWKYRSISYRCLLLVEGFIKGMNGLVMTLKKGLLMTLKEDKIFKCLATHSQYSLPVEALNVIVILQIFAHWGKYR